MADESHLEILKQGIEKWNKWRDEHPDVMPDLSGAHLEGSHLERINLQNADLRNVKLRGAYLDRAYLQGANLDRAELQRAQLVDVDLQGAHLWNTHLSRAYLQDAKLQGAYMQHCDLLGAYLMNACLKHTNLQNAELIETNLSGADLTNACLKHAKLRGAYLEKASLKQAKLQDADLRGAYLWEANLEDANLEGANLIGAILLETNVNNTILNDCKVYGAAVWDLNGEPKAQKNLVISRTYEPYNKPEITVDDLEIAHFIYMILDHKKLSKVISATTSKVVLILGRFTEKRREILKAVQERLRTSTDGEGIARYVPVMFDFPPDPSRDLMETVQILIGISHFVIADISEPKGVLVELTAIVPQWEVPVKLIIDISKRQPHKTLLVEMLTHLTKHKWLMNEVYGYHSASQLCGALEKEIIDPLENMARQLQHEKEKRKIQINEGFRT